MKWFVLSGLFNRHWTVLCNIRSSKAVCGIRPGAMEAEATENDEASRGDNGGDTFLFTRVSDFVSRFRIKYMRKKIAAPKGTERENRHGPVLNRHVIDGGPHGHIGLMGKAEVSTVLMP